MLKKSTLQHKAAAASSANLLSNNNLTKLEANSIGNSSKPKVKSAESKSNKIMDDQTLIDDMQQSSCSQCIAEDNSFHQFGVTREDLYNQQASPLFKYHIGMCSLIFMSITAVLLISDLKK